MARTEVNVETDGLSAGESIDPTTLVIGPDDDGEDDERDDLDEDDGA